MKYEFIELHRKSYPVSALCLAVQVAVARTMLLVIDPPRHAVCGSPR